MKPGEFIESRYCYPPVSPEPLMAAIALFAVGVACALFIVGAIRLMAEPNGDDE